VLDVAFVLFYADGIRTVGIDLVIERAGVAKASFYRHFPSKAALIVAYLDRRRDAFLAWLSEEVATRASGPREQLLAIFDALGELSMDSDYRGCAFNNALAEAGADPLVLERVTAYKYALRAYLTGLAKAAECSAPGDIADAWMVLVDGTMVGGRVCRNPRPAQQARRAAALLLDDDAG